MRVAGWARDSDVEVFCFFSSEKKVFFADLTNIDQALPMTIEHLRQQAVEMRSRGAHAEALAIFREIVQAWPGDARSHVDIAICLNALGRTAEAIQGLTATLAGACSSGPWHKHCLLQLARSHRALGDDAQSAHYLEACLVRWPDDTVALLDAAHAFASLGRFDQARDIYARVDALVSSTPDDPRKRSFVSAQATFEWMHGDFNMAIGILTQWVAANADAELTRRLIDYLARAGRGEEAFDQLYAAYVRGILTWDEEKSFILHVRLLRQFGHFETAVSMVKLYLLKSPASDGVRWLLAEHYVRSLEPDAAKEALAHCNAGGRALFMAMVEKQLGNDAQARMLLTRCIESRSGTSDALKHLFYIELFALNFEIAGSALETRRRLHPDHYTNQLCRDELDLFVEHQALLIDLSNADGIEALCNAHLRHQQAASHYGACCSAWYFLRKVADMRRWRGISRQQVFAGGGGKTTIPKIIVQYWDQPEIPDDVSRTMLTWKNAYPDFEYHIFDYKSALTLLMANFPSALATRFGLAHHPAMRSDIFRMAWLSLRGGFYVDADEYCTGRSNIFALDTTLLMPMATDNDTRIENKFLGATPGHPVTKHYLENIMSFAEAEFADGLIWWLTGPGHMGRLIAARVAKTLLIENTVPAPVPHEIVSPDMTLLPTVLLDNCMFVPRLAYKSTTLSWQRARLQ
jgi:tetratricopeptide (TPR) repeat protein